MHLLQTNTFLCLSLCLVSDRFRTYITKLQITKFKEDWRLMDSLDPFYLALLYFRVNKIKEAHEECSRLLEKNPYDQVFEDLKFDY